MFYNGELYDDASLQSNVNDGILIFKQLTKITTINSIETNAEIGALLESLTGEWAIVIIDKLLSTLYFGRDCLGRRSLVWNINAMTPPMPLYITSIGIKTLDIEWEEVPALGYHSLSLTDHHYKTILYPWSPEKQFILNTEIPDFILTPEYYTRPLFQSYVTECARLLSLSVEKRLKAIPTRTTSNGIDELEKEKEANVGLLFSGGLDCMILAYYTHIHTPKHLSIDLLTVAFSGDNRSVDECPDRITAKQGVEELRRVTNGERVWRMIMVDVSIEESKLEGERVEEVMLPSKSVMDKSIAIAFWFAARGKGYADNDEENKRCITSGVKVLLSGLGADEQTGGYGRHQGYFQRNGWGGLISELQKDVSRLPTRNLGRDDRIVADHGREVRFPYLDEELVRFLSGLKVHDKCNVEWEKGVGDKIILRHVAKRLGLLKSSGEPKRAVQFGARSAKITGKKEKGTADC